MRAFIINPWIYDFIAYDFWQKPAALLFIADFLRKSNIEVTFLDLLNRLDPEMPPTKTNEYGTGKYFFEEIEKPELLKHIPFRYKRFGLPYAAARRRIEMIIREQRPDFIIVSTAMTYWYPGTEEVIRMVKDISPHIPVFHGGIFPTLYPDFAKKISAADYVISGDGIPFLGKILRDKFGGNPFKCKKHWFNCLDPDFHLYEKLLYLPVYTSVGCGFGCTYCPANILQPNFTQKTPEHTVNFILKNHKRFAFKNISFFDDNLLRNFNNNLKEILDAEELRNLNLNFHLPNGINIRSFNKNVAKWLKKSNFKTIHFGLETLINERQNATGGKLTAADFFRTADILHKYGLAENTSFYILIGLADQTKEEIEYTIKQVRRVGMNFKLTEYSPVPFTPEYNLQKEKGIIPDTMDPLLGNSFLLYFRDKRFSLEYKKYLLTN